jgi:TldD protein
VARVTVRVGDYKTDSSGGRGDGSSSATGRARRRSHRSAGRSVAGTDQAYKSALAAYAQKQAQLKQVQTPPQQDDFSSGETPVDLARRAAFAAASWMRAAWTERVAEASGLYRTDPRQGRRARCAVRDGDFMRAREHLAGQQRRDHRAQGSTSYEEGFAVGTQAADGMHLDRSYASTAFRWPIWIARRL